MILTIDIGNTTIGIAGAVREDSGEFRLCFTGKLETNRDWTVGEYAPQFRKVLESCGAQPEDFSGAALSSVVPPVQKAIEDCVRTILGVEPVCISCKSNLGIRLDVDYPEKVGCDRLVDSAWAAAKYPLPAVTVDMGTATTLNVITADKRMCGGVIAPGLLTGLRALSSGTAQLPDVELKVPEHIIGRNTSDCMLSGAVAGTAAMLDGIVVGIEEELGEPVTLLLTGGGAEFVRPLVKHPHRYDPDFIFKGLAYLYHRNRKAI